MERWGWKTSCFILCLLAVLMGGGIFGAADSNTPTALEQARNSLSGITVEEQRVTAALFELSSQIQLLDTQIRDLNHDIAIQREAAAAKQQQIDRATVSYERVRDAVGAVLRARQRAGAASSIDALLSAESLTDLIHRINLLRDLSRNTNSQMEAISKAKAQLDNERKALAQLVDGLEARQQDVVRAKAAQAKVRKTLEIRLESLSAQKGRYQGYLATMETQWKSLKPLFRETVRSFNGIIASGGLPPDTVVMSYSLFGAKGTILEGPFNQALAKRSELPRMAFDIHPEVVTLDFPGYSMVLQGQFRLRDPQTIEYVVTGGAFYNVALNRSALEDLFSEGDFVFQLRSMIGSNRINRIDTQEGTMDLWINGTP